MDHILQEFEPTSYETWIDQLKKDLKGTPLKDLESNPEPDLLIQAYHHKDKADNLTVKSGSDKYKNDWKIRQTFYGSEQSNEKILTALNDGIEAIGIEINEDTDFDKVTADVLFDHIESDFKFKSRIIAEQFKAPNNAILNFDVLALNAALGINDYSLADFYSFYQTHKTHKTVWISGSLYGIAGASSVQELAFAINHLNEYIQFLVNEGEDLATINDKIVIELSVNDNYFVNISKFRSIQALIELLFKGYDPSYKVKPVRVHALTNTRHLAENDSNNNPLRETTQAMSAVIGGCDSLTVQYLTIGTIQDVERSKRIAKNIQLILREEAYLNNVVDPSHGAYYIESLTIQIITKAWDLFLEIEKNGGTIACLNAGIIQQKIDENKAQLIEDLKQNKRIFLGVNKHPNATETWVNKSVPKPSDKSTFKPLSAFMLENHYSKTIINHG